jgi:hypothetical protein
MSEHTSIGNTHYVQKMTHEQWNPNPFSVQFFPMTKRSPINFCVWTFTPCAHKMNFCVHIFSFCVWKFCCCVWLWVLFVPHF